MAREKERPGMVSRIKILVHVCQIIGPAAVGYAGYVPTPMSGGKEKEGRGAKDMK